MYYFICTILIMVFCIVALTSKNSIESESFIRMPKPVLPKRNFPAAQQTIKHQNKLQFNQAQPGFDGRNKTTGVSRITLRCLPAHYWMGMQTRQHYSIRGFYTANEQLTGSLIYYTLRVRRTTMPGHDDWSVTFFQVNQNYQLKLPAASVYPTVLTIPAASFFATNSKNEAIRRISASTGQSHSLALLRYNTLQAPINTGTFSRKILSAKYQKEKIC